MKLKFSTENLFYEGVLEAPNTNNLMKFNVKVDRKFILKGHLILQSNRTFEFSEFTTSSFDVTNYPFEIAIFKREIINLMAKKNYKYSSDYFVTFNDLAKKSTEGSYSPTEQKVSSFEITQFVKDNMKVFKSLEVNSFIFGNSLISKKEFEELTPKLLAFGFVKSIEKTYEKPYTLVSFGNKGLVIQEKEILVKLAKSLKLIYEDNRISSTKFIEILTNNYKVPLNVGFINGAVRSLF